MRLLSAPASLSVEDPPTAAHSDVRHLSGAHRALGVIPAPGLVGEVAEVALPDFHEEEDIHLGKVAAATRYLYRCRIAGDERPVGVLLRELVSESYAAELEVAIGSFFEGRAF